MYAVSDRYRAAVGGSARSFYYAGEITASDGTVYGFTSADIVKGSAYITNQCSGDSEIEMGSVYAAELGMTLYSDIDRYTLEGGSVTVSFFLDTGGGEYEEVPLGVFDISEANRTINCLEIKAYDHMLRFEEDFEDSATSGTAYEIITLACEQCGVELAHEREEMEGWPNGSAVLGIYADNDIETWRDVVYYAAQALGRFATIDREGRLELREYGTEPVTDIPQAQRFSSSFSDFVTRYTAISSTNKRTDTAEYCALDTDDGLTMNLGANPLLQFGLAETREKLLANILNAVSSFAYVPFDAVTTGDPSLDLGDALTFSGGHADGSRMSCVTKYEYRLGGRHTLKCVGKNPRLSSAKSKNDKNITGLLNSVEADRIAVYTYMNASAFTLGENETEVASLEFASSSATDAQFSASILLDVAADAVERSAGTTVTLPAPEEGEEGTELPVDISWEEDGQAAVTAAYVFNDSRVTTYVPVETFRSGRHILNLYYPLSGLSSNTYYTFRLLLSVTGGSAGVGRSDAICTISGQGLASNSTWDGRTECSESMRALGLSGGISPAPMSSGVSAGLGSPMAGGTADSHAKIKLAGFRVAGFGASLAVDPVTVTDTVDVSDTGGMEYDAELVSTDGTFALASGDAAPQTVYTGNFVFDSTVTGIENIEADSDETALFAFSFDVGGTWLAYVDGAWAALSGEASGISAESVAAIGTDAWAEACTDRQAMVRFTLFESSYVNSITIHYLNTEG